MPTLQLNTDNARQVGTAIVQANANLQTLVSQLANSAATLEPEWTGGGSAQFSTELAALLRSLGQLSETGQALGQRVQREADEWEAVAATFGAAGAVGAASAVGAGAVGVGAAAGAGAGAAGSGGASEVRVATQVVDPVRAPNSRDMHVTDVPPLTYGRFSALAYLDPNSPFPGDLQQAGWEIIGTSHDLLPTTREGYDGVAFYNKHTGELVIAHRGTDGLNPASRSNPDLRSVGHISAGNIPPQYEFSARFTVMIQDKLQATYGMDTPYHVVHTGHSLGGALADLNALSSDTKAITFENPGVGAIVEARSEIFSGNPENLVTYTADSHNFIQDIGDPVGYEYLVSIKNSDENRNLTNIITHTTENHSLTNMLDAFDPNTGFPTGRVPIHKPNQ